MVSVEVEGIKLNAKPISKRQLSAVWKTLSNKPYPRIKAYQLRDHDFNRVIQLGKCREDELRELREWNTILTTEGTDACVFNTDKTVGLDFMILIRENPYNKFGEILKHELSHIAKGDL